MLPHSARLGRGGGNWDLGIAARSEGGGAGLGQGTPPTGKRVRTCLRAGEWRLPSQPCSSHFLLVRARTPQGVTPCPRPLDRSVMRVPDHVRVFKFSGTTRNINSPQVRLNQRGRIGVAAWYFRSSNGAQNRDGRKSSLWSDRRARLTYMTVIRRPDAKGVRPSCGPGQHTGFARAAN